MDTIVALATAPVPAGLAVVRLSGERAHAIALELAGQPALAHARLRLCALRADEELIDHGYVVAFHAPRSFTGEDVAEFQVHGSLAVVDRLIAACVDRGARLARPGEYTQRAYVNGKLDLLQAEALADLISARAESSRQAALESLDGILSQALAELRTPLIHAIADVEARIDFAAEPHLAEINRHALHQQVQALAGRLRELLGTAVAGRIRLHGARVVLYGAPNAGKSTLFNALCGADRALVDARPGTTRDTVEVQTAPEGLLVTWVDTAGLRDAEDPVERAGRARAEIAARHADVVIWLEDQSRAFSGLATPQSDGVVLKVLNKTDLPADANWQHRVDWQGAIALCAHHDRDVQPLRAVVVASVRQSVRGALGQVALSRQRHVAAVQTALQALDRADMALEHGFPLELLAADLRDAALALDELTGAIVPDDVLDAVFSQFCIGK